MACSVEERDGKFWYKIQQEDMDRYYERYPDASYYFDILREYVEKRWWPGDCLGGMVENDLRGFFSHADETVSRRARDIFIFVYNVLPSSCWGSKEKVAKFLMGEEEE